MKQYIFTLLISALFLPVWANTGRPKTIAHRGYWQTEGSAQNSIASLRKAQELKCAGSECDVHLTTDGVVVLSHDGKINDIRIQEATWDQLKEVTLANGEKIPRLEEYLTQAAKRPATHPVIEIKQHSTPEREKAACAAVAAIVTRMNALDYVEYISFSHTICVEMARLLPGKRIAYITAGRPAGSVEQLHAEGITGIDYYFPLYRNRPEYVAEAHALGMFVSTWTVNSEEDMLEMAALGVDYITTDVPQMALQLKRAVPYRILPRPQQVSYTDDSFVWKDRVSLAFPSELAGEAELAREWLTADYLLHPVPGEGKAKGDVCLKLDPAVLPEHPEGYQINISKSCITISANTKTGIIYGVQTLRQLIRREGAQLLTQTGTITDYPTFGWRAFMLDESRHFFGMKIVKQLLDEMSALKMNTFNWHLTDSEGWRMEIKKWPQLTEKGAQRNFTLLANKRITPTTAPKYWKYYYPLRAYYTQDEIREVVDYAARRGIRIVPEMEMPGHCAAAIAAYPWLGAASRRDSVPQDGDLFMVCDPRVETFFHDVLDEMMALFPSGIIHIGTDEAENAWPEAWGKSPETLQFMHEHQLDSFLDLHLWSINRLEQYLLDHGYRAMGFGRTDIAQKSQGSNRMIYQHWHPQPQLVNDAVQRGYEVVNSDARWTYFDLPRSLKTSYSFDPVPEGIPADKQRQILGLSCQMWTEYAPSEALLHAKVFPRIAAFAETGWSAKTAKNYNRFLQSLTGYFFPRWERAGVGYVPVDHYTDEMPLYWPHFKE
jgi:hexosaminidase